ncbi:MAG: hydroxymethylbilane synthase [Candidatus Dadabacteria bacterium]|nr:hydroxymethylbilane synthase [Candidatus Dadabacteria bacterium]MYA47721.1 hydroxymethylbilane synthase [Candidatus Dadabacteria bacterium]MYG83326.1 hydroxymethylbilane synthase [Candidatus Dadabacteria bacterium]MYK50111.1 hydroxymethylbilane synthase [Candidatus Dadabacteria bacterium]
MTKLRIGTRGSRLALHQARLVETELHAAFPSLETEIKEIKTSGDINPEQDISGMGGKGIFVKEIEQSLLSDEIDIAVHSMKDMPSVLPDGLVISSALKREDPRDVFISKDGRTLEQLGGEGRVGTGSVRRKAQILSWFPDLSVVPIRGNVDTRLRKILSEGLDGIILAAAGLNRLGLSERITQYFARDYLVPAPCQGIIAVEFREDDVETRNFVSAITHTDTETAALFERSFLKTFGGDCQIPLGCCAEVHLGEISANSVFMDMEKNTVSRNTWECSAEKTSAEGGFMAKDLMERAGFSP